MSDPSAPEPARALVRPSPLRLHSLALVAERRQPGRKGAPFAASLLVHSTLVVLVVLVPLLRRDALPQVQAFMAPLDVSREIEPRRQGEERQRHHAEQRCLSHVYLSYNVAPPFESDVPGILSCWLMPVFSPSGNLEGHVHACVP